MGLIQRLIFFVYTLLFTLLSLGVILTALRLVPADLAWTSVSSIEGNLIIGMAGGGIFLAGLWSLAAGLLKKQERKSITNYNRLGAVNISLAAVEALIEKATDTIPGVRSTKVTVSLADSNAATGAVATVKTVISHDAHIPTVTADMQSRIQECVKNAIGMELEEIKIVVETISNDSKARSRVR